MPPSPPSHPQRSILQILIVALLLLAAMALASNDLGVARGLVPPGTVVTLPDGTPEKTA